MAAKEHEEWNKKKKKYHLAVFLGFDYDDYINWGEWERGPQKNLKKATSSKQQAENRCAHLGPGPLWPPARGKIFLFILIYFIFFGGGIF